MTANLLDPHVSGAPGGAESLAGHRGANDQDQTREAAALTGGVGGTGLGAHGGTQSGYAPSTNSSTAVGSGSTSGEGSTPVGPHKSSLLNKLDPRVDSDLSKQQSGTGSSTAGRSDPYAAQTSGSSHGHAGEARGPGAGGAAGAAAYEARKDQHPHHATTTAAGLNQPPQYDGTSDDPRVDGSRSALGDTTNITGQPRDHHLGRDTTLGAGAGGLAYEAQKHHGQPTQSSAYPDITGVGSHGGTGRPVANDMPRSEVTGSSQQPATARDHHLGRDATLGAGAGGLTYEADKHHGSDRSGVASTPQDQLAGSGHQATLGPSETPSTGLGSREPAPSHYTGHDAALGAAAGGIGAEGKSSHISME